MKIRVFTRKVLSLICAVFIFSSTMVTSFYIRPLEVYAASVALEFGEGFLSVVCDVLFSFGCKFSGYVQAASAVVSFSDFYEKRRVEILEEAAENPDYLKQQLRFGYKAKEDTRDKEVVITKEKMVSAADWGIAHQADDKIDSLSDLPEEFIQAAQAFAISELNISAVDGSAPNTSIMVDAMAYYYSFETLRHSGSYKDMTVSYTGSLWWDSYRYYATPGTTVMIERTTGFSGSYTFDGGTVADNGICYVSRDVLDTSSVVGSVTSFQHCLGNYKSAVYPHGEVPPISFPGNYSFLNLRFPLSVTYSSSPSVDVPYAGAGAVTWNGTADIGKTIDNQNAAASLDEYIGKTLTANGEIVVPTDPAFPDESESSGTGEGDVTLTGIAAWLQKIFNGILALPGNIASAFDSALVNIGTKIDAIPSVLADIRDKIISIPDNIGKELAKLGDWLQTIPGALADIKDQVIAVPKSIAAEISAFFAIDTTRINNSYSDMTNALKAKLSAINQIIDIFDKTNYSFSDTPPVFTMQTPDALKQAVQSDTIVIMDLTKYADAFYWCRTILSAVLWVAFGKWVLDQFDVQFHVG
ncbi:hypothetical protein PM001_01760 [[Clostridium] symbiosum]|nr:hypothetical protein [[Clostridium] symbiosum]MDB2034828.1 hypothetical protein [[Clostridium] symbiosum]SUY63373.1 Uncharacterised protein [[Clostridium] symbiosum]